MIKDIEIPEENSFQFDLLKLESFTDNVINQINTKDGPNVIGICGPWGCGKTTFLKILKRELEKRESKVAYFSAWENDWSDNPLVSIFYEIDSLFRADSQENKTELQKARDIVNSSFFNNGKRFVTNLVLNTIELGTAGVIDRESVTQLFQESRKGVNDAVDAYEKEKMAREMLIGHLKTISSSYTLSTGTPPVILIDELDRCRPDYAIRLLESIKHIFGQTDFVFIIAYHREQLTVSIKHSYGLDTAAGAYLNKLITLEIPFPTESAIEYFFNHKSRTELEDSQASVRVANILVKPSPRDQNFILDTLSRIQIPEKTSPGLIILMILLFRKDPGKFRYWPRNTYRDSYEQIISLFSGEIDFPLINADADLKYALAIIFLSLLNCYQPVFNSSDSNVIIAQMDYDPLNALKLDIHETIKNARDAFRFSSQRNKILAVKNSILYNTQS